MAAILQDTSEMEYSPKGIKDYLLVIKRRKYQALITMFVIFLIVLAAAFGLPPIYQSSSTILVEQQEIPQDLVRSTITSYADQRIQVISQRVMTRDNLWSVIQKYDIYKKEREKEPREVIIRKMRSDIRLNTISADVVDPRSGRPVQATIAFKLAYQSNAAGTAQKVANELTTLYLNENLKSRSEMAAETSVFLSEEVRKLEQEISGLEEKLAEFKAKNVNNLPELADLNFSLMDRTERELFEVARQLRLVQERKIYLTAELAQLNPSSTVISGSGERILSPAGRLKILESEYVRLSASYSADHPDVARIVKEMEALRSETGDYVESDEISKRLVAIRTELAVAKRKYSADHPDVIKLEKSVAEIEEVVNSRRQNQLETNRIIKSDNPAYIQLQADLDAAQNEIVSLTGRRSLLRNRLSDFENRLVTTPQIEREYNNLSRNYDNALIKYREIKAKQMEARLAESLEIERKGERFTLIEQPLLPGKPIKPNRIMILLLGFCFAIGAGISLAFLLDAIDGNIHGRKAVVNIIGELPLCEIPYIQTEQERANKFKILRIALIVMVVGIIVLALLFHFLFMPIDTFWFIMLRRLGF